MKYLKLLLILLIIYAIIIIFTFPLTSISADEGTHLLLGMFYLDLFKFVSENGFSHAYDFAINYLIHYPKLTVYYPPLYHYLIAFGFNFIISEYIGKFITLIFSIGTILLTYVIGKYLFNQKTGLISALLLVFSPIMIYLSGHIYGDTSVFFFSLLTLWFYLKAFKTGKSIYYTLGGLSLGLSLLTKWTTIPIIPLILIYFLVERKNTRRRKIIKKFVFSLILALIVFSPYLFLAYKFDFINLTLIGPVEAGYKEEHDPQFYEIEGWLWYPIKLVEQLSLPVALLCFLALIIFVRKKVENWKLILLWFLSFYIIYTIMPNKNIRYIVAYLPVFLFPLSYFIERFSSKKKYWNVFFILLLVSQIFISFYYLPRYNYPMHQIAEIVYNNSKGNVAIVSEKGKVHSSAFMFHLAKLDKNRTIIVYRPCVFYRKEGQIQQFLKENNIYYLILVKDGYGYENLEKIKDVELEKEFYYAKLYRYKGFDGKGTKKCNYICLTEEEICYREF